MAATANARINTGNAAMKRLANMFAVFMVLLDSNLWAAHAGTVAGYFPSQAFHETMPLRLNPVANVASTCNATTKSDWSVGVHILHELSASSPAQCCADCLSNPRCMAYVLHGATYYLKVTLTLTP